MCCIASCLSSCGGGSCGYCSECVGTAACNPTLCSTCLTGTCVYAPVCTPTPGTNPCICSNSPTSCTPTCIADLPYAGQDVSGNDIYQNSDGSLRYADGSPATRADIADASGACVGTPCSPKTCGTTDQPPSAGSSGKSPSGGGSGGGSAKSAGGSPRATPANCQASKLSQAMNRFGSSLASLFSGGKPGPVIAGHPATAANTGISSNTFLLVIVVIGILLLVMAFGHNPVAD